MQQFEIEVTTPVEKVKVKIKTLLSGGEQEAIDAAAMSHVEVVSVDADNKPVFNPKSSDFAKTASAQRDAVLAYSVMSINDDATDVVKRLKKLNVIDYDFVVKSIETEQKKIKEKYSTGEQSQ